MKFEGNMVFRCGMAIQAEVINSPFSVLKEVFRPLPWFGRTQCSDKSNPASEAESNR